MKESPLYEEIKDEGRLETQQANILAVLEERFGARAAVPFREAVQHMTKLDKLSRLHRLAVRCATVEEFQGGLRKHT